MKINQNTKIVGEKVILVPYRRHHVLKYHDWMSLNEIQELTASEPLSLEEEYEMQLKWQQDPDKLTFLVLSREMFESCNLIDKNEREIYSMIGDVNCFISIDYEIDQTDTYLGELEIMIVDKENRGKGYGKEAVYLMINYCTQYLKEPRINTFIVKIGEDNIPSIKMFEKLGFIRSGYLSAFKQVSLKLDLNEKLFDKINFKLNIDCEY